MKAKQIPVGPRLHVGMFSKRVLLAKNVWAEPQGDGSALFHVRGEQIDVTEQFEECARELGWIPPGEDTKRAIGDAAYAVLGDDSYHKEVAEAVVEALKIA